MKILLFILRLETRFRMAQFEFSLKIVGVVFFRFLR
jgi:hypothetical protein